MPAQWPPRPTGALIHSDAQAFQHAFTPVLFIFPQLNALVEYFRKRRQSQLDEVLSALEEAKSLKLLEDMYSKDDVEAIIDACTSEVRKNAGEELETMVRQVTLYLQQAYLQAEGNGVSLSVDTKILDDSKLLEDMKNLTFGSGVSSNPSPKRGGLAPLAPLSRNKVDGSLVAKVNALETDKKSLQGRVKELGQQLREALKAKTGLEEKLAAGGAAASGEAQLEARLKRVEGELKKAKADLDGRLTASTAFQNLKTMLTKKNKQLKVARAKLAKLAPSVSAGGALNIEDD